MSITKPNDLIHSFSGNSHSEPNFNGLTKREYFAVSAMQGELSGEHSQKSWANEKDLAERSVLIADALINELNKRRC